MEGVEKLELLTRASLVVAESAALVPSYKRKSSSISARALNVAGVERFELPTRAIFGKSGNPLLCQLNSSASKSKKAPVFRLEPLEYGRGGEIRTPNTRYFW